MEYNKKRIASLALFRNLYNEGNSDVTTILCEFAKGVIYGKHLTAFTPTQIKNELKQEYEFNNIPEYVVESVIKKFCRKENSKYYPNEDVSNQKVSNQEIEKIEKCHEVITSMLVSFVENKTSKNLTIEEKEILLQSFYAFLIDETDVKYAEYISAFVIETQNDVNLSKSLQTIKEGVVLFTGIQYNDRINEIGSWKDDFTIYIEQEILFHMAGYNGVLYQQLFTDFFDLVKEINFKSRKQLVKLKYFDSVKDEIDRFFTIAERIVDGKETLDCSNIAMTSIIQGCDHKSDVIAKKIAFYDMLKKNSIIVEDGDSYFKQNFKFNIFYDENLKTLSDDLPQRDVEWSLKLLNYISMIRKGEMSGFEKSKCILLTGNSTTMAVAFHPSIKQNGNVPFATTLDYITNKFWFKLNKGFGNNVYPKSFNVVTKAQIILSTQIVGSVSQEFEKIKKEIQEKNKPESVIVAELAELKTRVRKPEEISKTNTDDVLATIEVADTEKYLRERDLERQMADEQRFQNKQLQIEIEKTNQERKEFESRKNAEIKQIENANAALSKQLEESKQNEKTQIKAQIDAISTRKNKADLKIAKRIKKMRWVPCILIVVFIVLAIILTYIHGWDKMEFWTWLFAILIASFPWVVYGLGFKEWNPMNVIDIWYKNKYTNKLYTEYDVDLHKLRDLENAYKSQF